MQINEIFQLPHKMPKMSRITSNTSIFVCFLCEAEYKDVDCLNEHMKSHENVPGEYGNIINLCLIINILFVSMVSYL